MLGGTGRMAARSLLGLASGMQFKHFTMHGKAVNEDCAETDSNGWRRG